MQSATPQKVQELEKRIVVLEKVIAEYAATYGLTETARAAMIAARRLDG